MFECMPILPGVRHSSLFTLWTAYNTACGVQRFIDDIGEEGTVAQNIAMSGYTMTLIMSPVKK